MRIFYSYPLVLYPWNMFVFMKQESGVHLQDGLRLRVGAGLVVLLKFY